MEALRALYDRAIAEEHGAVVLAGDIFHRRGMVPVGVMNGLAKLVTDASDKGITTYAIPGNHDYVDKDAKWAEEHLHSLFWLSGRIVIVSEPQVVRIKESRGSTVACLIPYKSSQAEWVAAAKALVTAAGAIRGSGPLVLFGHQSLDGAKVGPHEYIMREGLNPDDIPAQFQQAIFGHYHQRQFIPTHGSLHNVLYVGGLIQHNFGERTYDPGFVELEQGKVAFIENRKSPRFDVLETASADEAQAFLNKCAEAGWYGQVRWNGKISEGAALAGGAKGHVVSMPSEKGTLRMTLTGSETPEEMVSNFVGHTLATGTKFENSVPFAEAVIAEGKDILATAHRSGSV